MYDDTNVKIQGTSYQYKIQSGSWKLMYVNTSAGVITGGSGAVWSAELLTYYGTSDVCLEGTEPVTLTITSGDNIVLGEVAGAETDFEAGYGVWAESAVTIPGIDAGSEEDTVRVYPLGLGPSWEDTRGLTQEQVWEGESTYEPSVVTGISVSHLPSSISPGSSITISPIVTGTGEFDISCICSLSGAQSEYTTLVERMAGTLWLLSVGASETAEKLQLTVTSAANPAVHVVHEIAVSTAVIGDAALGDVDAGSFLDKLGAMITAPFEWLGNFLLDGIKAIFVPSEDFLTAKITALRAEFSWVDSLLPILEVFTNWWAELLNLEPEPPVVYIDLSATRGSYDIGEKTAFIDMHWYAEYKPTVDALISAVLWVAFVWKLLQKAPGIISGMPGDFVMDGIQTLGFSDRLPSRKAAYEIQRQSNLQSIRKGPGK